MSKARDQHSKSVAEKLAAQRAMERGVWGAIGLIVAFILLLWFLLARDTFGEAVVGAVLAVLGWSSFVAVKAYRGVKLPQWQQALAKVPLRFAGYGTEGGKPIDAAKGQRNALYAILMFIGASIILVVVLAFVMIPDLRR